MEWVVAERNFDVALTPDMVRQLAAESGPCGPMYGVKPVSSYLAGDGKRMICVFRAPDAEAVRTMFRNGGSPNAKVWTASRHVP
ncbi:MAG: nickel-binding protein [Myxococcota bacterium]